MSLRRGWIHELLVESKWRSRRHWRPTATRKLATPWLKRTSAISKPMLATWLPITATWPPTFMTSPTTTMAQQSEIGGPPRGTECNLEPTVALPKQTDKGSQRRIHRTQMRELPRAQQGVGLNIVWG
jgi:hypothetical protein